MDATLDKYLRSLQSLPSEDDYSRSKAVVEEFRALGGARETLQVRINMSYFTAYPDDSLGIAQKARAASLVAAVFNFREQILK